MNFLLYPRGKAAHLHSHGNQRLVLFIPSCGVSIAQIEMEQQPLILTVEKYGSVSVVILNGRVDSAVADAFLAQLSEIIAGGCRALVLDFAQLSFISSIGLRVLLACDKKMKQQNGKICVCQLSESVKEVFDITAFSSIFPAFATREAAIAHAAS